jgi:hypothetical protein
MTMLKFNLLSPSQFDGTGHSSAGGLGLGLREGLIFLNFLTHCIMLPAAFSLAGPPDLQALEKVSPPCGNIWQLKKKSNPMLLSTFLGCEE